MKLILAYAPDGRRALFWASDADLEANLAAHPDWAIRLLDGSPLSNAATLSDPRVPKTMAEFDAAYPGLQFPPPKA